MYSVQRRCGSANTIKDNRIQEKPYNNYTKFRRLELLTTNQSQGAGKQNVQLNLGRRFIAYYNKSHDMIFLKDSTSK